MKISILSRIAFVAAVGFLASCKSSTTTEPNTTTPTTVKPGVGTTYNFQKTETDSMGMTVKTSNEVHTVINNNTTIGTVTGAYLIQSTGADGSKDTTAIHYEQSGDVSVLQGLDWARLPFATKSATNATTDVSAEETGIGVGFHIVSTFTGTGNSTLTIKGKNFTAEKVHADMNTSVIASGQTLGSFASATDYWFIPELGYIGKVSTPAYKIDTEWQNGEMEVLTNYSLK